MLDLSWPGLGPREQEQGMRGRKIASGLKWALSDLVTYHHASVLGRVYIYMWLRITVHQRGSHNCVLQVIWSHCS